MQDCSMFRIVAQLAKNFGLAILWDKLLLLAKLESHVLDSPPHFKSSRILIFVFIKVLSYIVRDIWNYYRYYYYVKNCSNITTMNTNFYGKNKVDINCINNMIYTLLHDEESARM